VLDLGLTISLSGIVTFKNAKDLQAIVAELPDDRLLVETDAPFLAPCRIAARSASRPSWPIRRVRGRLARHQQRALAGVTGTTSSACSARPERPAVKLVMLGSGTSTGVPRIGNDWGDCDPGEPRNRTRVAIVVEGADGSRILVDTPTDLRQQLLATEIDRIDGVVWTHSRRSHPWHRRSAPAAHGPWRADPGLCRR
jgi:hypothetical protein